MPRTRALKPQFFKDPELADLPLHARMLYAGLWCQADRAGRLKDDPKYLKIEIFPWDEVGVEELLKLLAVPRKHKPGHIVRYEVAGEPYIFIPQFLKHQKPHHKEMPSEIPPPPLAPVPNPGPAPIQSGPAPTQASANPVDPGSLILDLDPDHPLSPPEGGTPVPIPLRLRKRTRAQTTLGEDLVANCDRIRNELSKLLHERLSRNGAIPEEEQVAWLQGRSGCSAEQATDAVGLVAQARAHLGEVRHAR
jgi:hypothetical protein